MLFRASAARISAILAESKWARRLREGGLGSDVAACAQVDLLDCVPVLADDRIVLLPRATAPSAGWRAPGTEAAGELA
jgi:phosphosulfolactate phosphohydrolase-like enzyme